MIESKLNTHFQTSVPTEVRYKLHLRPGDRLRWEVADGIARLARVRRAFLERGGHIRVGPGSSVEDIQKARQTRGQD